MCVNCIRSQVDITEGIQKQVTILWCKDCGRYLQPPKHWLRAELESKELLTFCVKKIKGLSKVRGGPGSREGVRQRSGAKEWYMAMQAAFEEGGGVRLGCAVQVKLVDAGFIWTEPHSKRLKVKLTIQAEVFNGAILQQSFVVDYTVENNMCPDCNRANANPNSWNACAQVRQHVFHKRTFLYLEQLILKHQAAEQAIKVTDIHEGIDFFFSSRSHALKLIDFLQNVVPIRFRADKQLVSHDTHSNTYNFKFTFSVEMAPVCKDDLVCLPVKLSAALGGLGPLVLCTKVTNQITLLDPLTLRGVSQNADVYWRNPYVALASQRALTEYIVLDVELTGQTQGRWALAEVQVARKSDFGRNDTRFNVRTHLGHLLQPGDTALGYDLSSMQPVALDFEAWVNKGGQVPDVILVRKSYEEKRRKRRDKGMPERLWKLKRLGMDVDDAAPATKGSRGAAANDAQARERDTQRFLEELEEDPEMRQHVNLYKDPEALQRLQQKAGAASGPAAAGPGTKGSGQLPAGLGDGMVDSDDDDDDLPEIPLDELLDDLEGLGLHEEEEGEGEGDDEEMEG
ncbi:hypothetical protein QJQ45_002905 [Haematococcus lacustris]|nr:hypothetical protein QJQ45_002905 [Haematococcus lacustris]